MITLERRGDASVLTIRRPQKRNALDHATLVLMGDAIDEVAADGTRVLIVTGSDDMFSAGADLSGVEGDEFQAALGRVLGGLCRLPTVVIAHVNGPALGAGMQLALAADVRMAASGARFAIPAGKLGLVVDGWTVARASLMLGHSAARSMLLAATSLSLERALALGFVDRLGTFDEALAWAGEIALLAPLSIAGHKVVFEEFAAFVESDMAREARRAAWASEDALEGPRAFMEKRPPVFRGR